MSTVIWHKNIMYSDSRITNTMTDGSEVYKVGEKMFRVGSKIYGVTGTLEGYNDFVERGYKRSWQCSRSKPYDVLIIEWNGKTLFGWKYIIKKIGPVYFSWFKKTKYKWKKHPNMTLSMGSGQPYASIAEDLGLNPKEMIQYASDRDSGTNDIVVTMSL